MHKPKDRALFNFPSMHASLGQREDWKALHCPAGWHLLFDRLMPPTPPAFAGCHELECAACGLIVKVDAVIVPVGNPPKNCS